HAGLLAPEDSSAQRVHPQPENSQKESLPADLALQTLVASGTSSAGSANAAATSSQAEIGRGPTLPLTSAPLALSAGSARMRNAPVSEQHSATGPTVAAVGTRSASFSQPLSVGNLAAS